jgi:hypothetical protein
MQKITGRLLTPSRDPSKINSSFCTINQRSVIAIDSAGTERRKIINLSFIHVPDVRRRAKVVAPPITSLNGQSSARAFAVPFDRLQNVAKITLACVGCHVAVAASDLGIKLLFAGLASTG